MPNLLKPGDEVVPGYVLVRRLGAGGSGEVWVARAAGGVQVAVKILRDLGLLASDRELEALRIVREAKHPNLCPLFGVWFFDEQHNLLSSEAAESILGSGSDLTETVCFAESRERESSADFDATSTETVAFSGHPTKPTQMIVAMGLGEQTLMDRLMQVQAERDLQAEESSDDPDSSNVASEPIGIDPHELIRYMASAASAIDELNERHNIYHCDIKPQNILLVGGQAQVCDFGLARKVEDTRKTSVAFGTPAYGAPEMLFERTYSKTIDQYSLAVTYYELRTGKLPYSSVTQSSLLRAKAIGDVDLSRVPPAERQVLARATDLDPKLRFGNCQALVAALTEAIKNPNAVIVDSSSRSVGYVIPIAVLSTIALLSAVGWWLWRGPTVADSGTLAAANVRLLDSNGSITAKEAPANSDSSDDGPNTSESNPTDPPKVEPIDPATIVNQKFLTVITNDDPIEKQLAETLEVTESSGFRQDYLTNQTVESLVQAIEKGTIAATTSNDAAMLQTITRLCNTLIPISSDQTSDDSQQVARLAFNNLLAAAKLAELDDGVVADDPIDQVRRLFDNKNRYAHPATSATAAISIATTWIPKFSKQEWDLELADRDISRALQLGRDVKESQPVLNELRSSYLMGLLGARSMTAEPQALNAATIRIAKELEDDPSWGSVARASIALADPTFQSYTPKPLAADDFTVDQLPPELHATYLLVLAGICGTINGTKRQ